MSKQYPDFEDKCLHRTTIQGDCIIWTGAKNRPDGYGVCWFEGKLRYVHVIAYARAHNIAIDSLSYHDIHHTCKNKFCINSNHLEKLTRSEHIRREPRHYNKKYCKRGHELAITGKHKDGRCKACRNMNSKLNYQRSHNAGTS